MIDFYCYFWPFINCSQQMMKKSLPVNPFEAPEGRSPSWVCLRLCQNGLWSFLSVPQWGGAVSFSLPCPTLLAPWALVTAWKWCAQHICTVIANEVIGIFGCINVINFGFFRAGFMSKPRGWIEALELVIHRTAASILKLCRESGFE